MARRRQQNMKTEEGKVEEKPEEPLLADSDKSFLVGLIKELVDEALNSRSIEQAEPSGSRGLDPRANMGEISAPAEFDGNVLFASPWFGLQVKLVPSQRITTGPSGEYQIEPPIMADFSPHGMYTVNEKETVVFRGKEVPVVEILRGYIERCARRQSRPDFVEVKPGETVEFANRRRRRPTPDTMNEEWSSPLILPDIPEPPEEAKDTLKRQEQAREGVRSLT